MSAGLDLASVSTLGAAGLAAAERAPRRAMRHRKAIANTLVSQVKKSHTETLTLAER